jgi:hypothetical protein
MPRLEAAVARPMHPLAAYFTAGADAPTPGLSARLAELVAGL